MVQEPISSSESILIVDADLNLQRSLALILRRNGYLVETSINAYEALDLLRNRTFDLILMDITTPANRLTFLPTVQSMYPKLPLLVFTSIWSPETTLELENLGLQANLKKPVNPDELLEILKKILAEKSRKNYQLS